MWRNFSSTTNDANPSSVPAAWPGSGDGALGVSTASPSEPTGGWELLTWLSLRGQASYGAGSHTRARVRSLQPRAKGGGGGAHARRGGGGSRQEVDAEGGGARVEHGGRVAVAAAATMGAAPL